MSRPRSSSVAAAVALAAVVAAGCQTYPDSGAALSPMQKRAMTTRLIQASYEDTFHAVMTVLQDQDYGIRETDMQAGLIVAEAQRPYSAERRGTGTLLGDVIELASGATVTEGSQFELSCVVDRITESATEIRLSIQATTYGSPNTNGVRREVAEQIYDPEVLRELFNQIDIEVQRRQAIRGTTLPNG